MLKIFSSLDLTFAKNQFFRPSFWYFVPDVPTKNKVVGGGHSPENVVWVCPAVKTPFSRLFHLSLDPTLSKNVKFWLLQDKFVKNLKNF